MKDDVLKKTIIKLTEPIAQSLKLTIWGLEILRAGRMIIRLYIDAPLSPPLMPEAAAPSSGENAARRSPSIDQCEEISRHLALALDVENLIEEAYTLEVSTPGFSRIFFNLAQMRPYLGDLMEVRLHDPVTPEPPDRTHPDPALSPRRLWRGRLNAVQDDAFVLEPAVISADGDIILEAFKPLCLLWKNVRRANRLHIFKLPAKPGKKTGASR
ncbi:MAG: ribosome maturation factor RimP [Desulfovibrio sp.]|jgi:ribosome maturation factor RimP|nr:ribosome maturation factor RimP [Desulfovibrio sp.]